MAAERKTFAPVITATKWVSVYDSAWQAAMKAGTVIGESSAVVPKLTNADAVRLIRGWSDEASRTLFPLWYQFAAVAYGWDPANDTTNALDASAARGTELYPVEATVMLWTELHRIAELLDNDRKETPRLYTDGTFADPFYADEVRTALAGDGATVQFKIPLPACKDPKTGKPVGRPHKGKDGKWTCDPVLIDDPITALMKSLMPLALVVGAVWLLTRKSNQPRRRRRNEAR